jgi:hypothetical protein
LDLTVPKKSHAKGTQKLWMDRAIEVLRMLKKQNASSKFAMDFSNEKCCNEKTTTCSSYYQSVRRISV